MGVEDFQIFDDDQSLATEAARLLSNGQIVHPLERSEFGPRAWETDR